jgi:hypothetical protein
MHRKNLFLFGLALMAGCSNIEESGVDTADTADTGEIEAPPVVQIDLIDSLTEGIDESNPLYAGHYADHWPEDVPGFSLYDMPVTFLMDHSKVNGDTRQCAFVFQVLEGEEDLWVAEIEVFQVLDTLPKRLSWLVPEDLLQYTQYRAAIGDCGGVGTSNFVDMMSWNDNDQLVAGGFLRSVVDDGTVNFHFCITGSPDRPWFTARCP